MKPEATITKRGNLLTALNELREECKFLKYKKERLSVLRVLTHYRLKNRIEIIEARIANLEEDIELAKQTKLKG